jgi:hypothetical protein
VVVVESWTAARRPQTCTPTVVTLALVFVSTAVLWGRVRCIVWVYAGWVSRWLWLWVLLFAVGVLRGVCRTMCFRGVLGVWGRLRGRCLLRRVSR